MDEKNYTLKEVADYFRVRVTTPPTTFRDGTPSRIPSTGRKKILVPESEIKRFPSSHENEPSRNRRGRGRVGVTASFRGTVFPPDILTVREVAAKIDLLDADDPTPSSIRLPSCDHLLDQRRSRCRSRDRRRPEGVS